MHVVMYKGQRYVFGGVRPIQRKDGSDALAVAWHTRCADCEAEFTCSVALGFGHTPNRRCDACKAPGKRVK